MSAREHLKYSNGPAAQTPKQGNRPLSKRGNRKMATSSKDDRTPEEANNESIPLTDREGNMIKNYPETKDRMRSTDNASDISKRIGPSILSQIPNSVPSDMEDEANISGRGRNERMGESVPNGNIVGSKEYTLTHTTTDTTYTRESQIDAHDSATDSRCNGSVKPDSGMEHIVVPVVSNNVPRKQSLTVPGAAVETQTATDRSRSDSIFSMGRESSKLSLGSPRSLEMKLHYAAIQISADEKNKSMFTPDDSMIRTAIPYLPLWVAILCLMMNIVIPGTGTMLSGCCIFCCAKSRVPAKYDQDLLQLLCVNVWVGVAQLFTVSFLLVGWFWSLVWGIKMVILSMERRRELRTQRAKELQTLALSAFGSAIPARLSEPS